MSAPKRFYQDASVSEHEDGYGVMLDTRMLRTPAGLALVLPNQSLARLVADEWRAQGAEIVHKSMPVTRLVFTALDRTPDTRTALIEHVGQYAETDLLCHRANAPATLVQRQTETWDAWVAWGARELDATFPVVSGLAVGEGADARRAAVTKAAGDLDDFSLTGLAHAASLSGSAILGFALARGAIDATQIYNAAALDDLWGIETWGEDSEARARLELLKTEFDATARYFAALT